MSYLNYFFKKTKLGQSIFEKRFRDMIEGKKKFKKEVINTDEGQKMIREKLQELHGKMIQLNQQLNKIQFDSASCPDAEDWFYKWWTEDLKIDIKKLKSKMYRFQLMKKEDGMSEVKLDTGFDIEAIKENVKIEDIMDRSPVQRNSEYDLYICPLHSEKTASFRVYKNQNSWYCFGACQKGGSVIDLFMELNDCNFVTACIALLQ